MMISENENNQSKNQREILAILKATYKGIGPALKFDSVYQLLVAVILSAQTNDNQVNKITAELFKNHGTPETMAQLSLEEIEDFIRTCGLYKNKAKSIYQTTRILLGQYGGEVPKDRDLLVKLPGVGRKTANVVLSVGFKEPALAVDTHVFRVSHRMGLSCGKMILSVAVLGILITAPLGAIGMDVGYKKLLSKE